MDLKDLFQRQKDNTKDIYPMTINTIFYLIICIWLSQELYYSKIKTEHNPHVNQQLSRWTNN